MSLQKVVALNYLHNFLFCRLYTLYTGPKKGTTLRKLYLQCIASGVRLRTKCTSLVYFFRFRHVEFGSFVSSGREDLFLRILRSMECILLLRIFRRIVLFLLKFSGWHYIIFFYIFWHFSLTFALKYLLKNAVPNWRLAS